jgi:ABC-type molybdate transport system substrate-binding protein
MASSLKVLSAGAVRRSVTAVARAFESANGASFDMDFSSAPKVRARVLGGEQSDIVIASSTALDTLAQESKIVVGSRVVLGRSRMVVVMRKGAAAPDLSGTEAFKRALVDAEQVLNNQGSSGIYVEKLIDRLALRERMGPKFRTVQNGAEMMEIIASHAGRVLGLAQISNLIDHVGRGSAVELAGFFPEEIQNGTLYEAAVSADSRDPGVAGKFVNSFASAESRKLLVASGLE